MLSCLSNSISLSASSDEYWLILEFCRACKRVKSLKTPTFFFILKSTEPKEDFLVEDEAEGRDYSDLKSEINFFGFQPYNILGFGRAFNGDKHISSAFATKASASIFWTPLVSIFWFFWNSLSLNAFFCLNTNCEQGSRSCMILITEMNISDETVELNSINSFKFNDSLL